MKLLSPQVKKAESEREEALKRIRRREIEEELGEKKHLLNTLNVDFDDAMVKQRDAYAREKEAHSAWQKEQETEVQELEARRKAALLPFTEREEKLTTREASVAQREKELRSKEMLIDEDRDLLENRLDEVMERELQVEKLETSLSQKKKGIDNQTDSIKEQSTFLSQALQQFSHEATTKERELLEKQVWIEAQMQVVHAQSTALGTREQALFNRAKRVADQEATLNRTLERMKRNTI